VTGRTAAARGAALVAAAATALTGCGFHGLYDVPLPGGADVGDHPYHVTVEFADVLDLVPQAAVRVNDVPVGRVDSVDLAGGPSRWHATVRLTLNGDVTLPANARAELRQTSLLGEKYVSLGGPTTEAPQGRLRDGALIPLARTGRNPEVEEVLAALSLVLNGGGLAQIQTINRELGDALQGREGAVRDLLTQLDTLLGGLDAQRGQITRALDSVNRLAATLSAQRGTIAGALDTLPGALRILADQRRQLTAMLTALQRLGRVGADVITASRDDLLADLAALRPTLTQLAAAGSALPNALELLVTYPFPKTAANGIRGDYTNLFVTVDMDVSDVLDNLLTDGQGNPNPPTLPAVTAVPGEPGLGGVPGLPQVPGLPNTPLPGLPAPDPLPGAPTVPNGPSGGDLPDLLGTLLGGGGR
jgi:phospholipid/cholesterol/gamma-HCH transport system substrate-binding protein